MLELRAADPTRTRMYAPEELFALEQLRPAVERRGFRIAER
jgi:hypothetical protein